MRATTLLLSRNARRLAWGLWALAVLLVVPGPVLTSVIDGGTADLPYLIAFVAVQLAAATTGAVVAARLPGNSIGWIFFAMGAALALALAANSWAEVGLASSAGPLPLDELAAWLGTWLFIPAVYGPFVLLLLLFPTGRPLTVRWAWLTRALIVVLALVAVSQAFKPGPIGPESNQVPNLLAVPGAVGEAMRLLERFTDLVAPFAVGSAAAAIVVRLRRSRGVERQQLKLFAFAAALAALGLALSIVTSGLAAALAFLAGMLALAGLPVAAGIAILRHRLYDIDLVINRALVYVALSAALGATYLAAVLVLQQVLGPLARGSDLAIAGSTLAVAALFRPLRARIQATVDRRFYRCRHDAARTLEGFSARLREQVDLDALGKELEAVVRDTLQPAHVSLWLRSTGGGGPR